MQIIKDLFEHILSNSFYAALLATAIGSILIILNEWVKIFFEQRKQKKKLSVWNALGESAPTSLSIKEISEKIGIDTERLKPLIYEMMCEGVVIKVQFGNFTIYNYKPEI